MPEASPSNLDQPRRGGIPLDRVTAASVRVQAQEWLRQLASGDLHVYPDQSGMNWSEQRKSVFMESVLLGMPMRDMVVVEQDDHHLILDGQQRLMTLVEFTNGEFPLRHLDSLTHLRGKRFDDLDEELRGAVLRTGFPAQVLSAPDLAPRDRIWTLQQRYNPDVARKGSPGAYEGAVYGNEGYGSGADQEAEADEPTLDM